VLLLYVDVVDGVVCVVVVIGVANDSVCVICRWPYISINYLWYCSVYAVFVSLLLAYSVVSLTVLLLLVVVLSVLSVLSVISVLVLLVMLVLLYRCVVVAVVVVVVYVDAVGVDGIDVGVVVVHAVVGGIHVRCGGVGCRIPRCFRCSC